MLDDKIKQRLKRLFAVAENDASCDNEIEQAMRYAKALMAEHQVSRDDVFEDEETGEIDISKVSFTRRFRYSRYTSICAWESWLCKFITAFVPGTGYYISRGEIRRNNGGMVVGKGEKATQIVFFGPSDDIAFCCEVWDEVVFVIQTAATLRFGEALSRGDAASYAEGFASMLFLVNQKQDDEVKDQAKTDSKALIVVNRSVALVDGGKKWLKDEHKVNLKSCKGATSAAAKNVSAFAQGQSEGRNYKPASEKKAGYLA